MEVDAVHKFERQVMDAVSFADLVDGDDIVVTEMDSALALEALERRAAFRSERRREYLEGRFFPGLHVHCPVHRPHAPGCDVRQDFILANCVAVFPRSRGYRRFRTHAGYPKTSIVNADGWDVSLRIAQFTAKTEPNRRILAPCSC